MLRSDSPACSFSFYAQKTEMFAHALGVDVIFPMAASHTPSVSSSYSACPNYVP